MTTGTTNPILFQGFEWHTPSQPPATDQTHSEGSHYSRLTRLLPSLSAIGVSSIWLPPGCKANNPSGNGYDCYDLWDLGEFDQKWARSVRWGSREELRDVMDVAKKLEVEVIWDAVLNHKTAGDSVEEGVWAVEVDKEDRRIEICEPKKISAWLKFDFPGREREDLKYSPFKWRAEHFNGTDWDQSRKKNAIYKLISDPATYPKPPLQQPQTSWLMARLGKFARRRSSGGRIKAPARPPPQKRPGKGWADDVDDLHGNSDYLMFSNVDYTHADVRKDVLDWGRWMVEDTGVDGFRLDAVQHFSYNFTREWIQHVQSVSDRRRKKPAFVVGEIWTNETPRITKWLDAVGQSTYAYDSPLLYNFSRISEDVRTGSPNADLRTVVSDSLLSTRPENAVTLVTNHDTQPGQTSYTPMLAELKPLWYAFILLRLEGYPCVFWGDLHGTHGPRAERPGCLVDDGRGGMRSVLPDLMLARRLFAYGEQKDYWDAQSCIAFTRAGQEGARSSGCVTIMSIGPRFVETKTKPGMAPRTGTEDQEVKEVNWTVKKMPFGKPGEVYVDVIGDTGERAEVTIDQDGCGVFPCRGRSVGVFVRKDADGVERFPVDFAWSVY